MKSLKIYDLGGLLRKPSRQDYLMDAVDSLESFFSRQKPPIEKDPSELVFDTMDELTSDLSLVFDVPFSNWSREHTINKTYDLACQCQRVNRYCRYDIFLWKYPKEETLDEEGLVRAKYLIPITGWVEMLPEPN